MLLGGARGAAAAAGRGGAAGGSALLAGLLRGRRRAATAAAARAPLPAVCGGGDADERWMRLALEEARAAFTAGEVPVGAVVVGSGGELLHRAHNAVEALQDPTAHAEMLCLRAAAGSLGSWRLEGASLFVTLEPCPMCAGALLQARISRLVWGAPNRLLGADGSWVHLLGGGGGSCAAMGGEEGREEGKGGDAPRHPFHPELLVERGVLGPECSALMRDFFRERREGRIPAPGEKPPVEVPAAERS